MCGSDLEKNIPVGHSHWSITDDIIYISFGLLSVSCEHWNPVLVLVGRVVPLLCPEKNTQ